MQAETALQKAHKLFDIALALAFEEGYQQGRIDAKRDRVLTREEAEDALDILSKHEERDEELNQSAR